MLKLFKVIVVVVEYFVLFVPSQVWSYLSYLRVVFLFVSSVECHLGDSGH